MRTQAIRPGDLVLVDKRGRIFYARVLGAGAMRGLTSSPSSSSTPRHGTPNDHERGQRG